MSQKSFVELRAVFVELRVINKYLLHRGPRRRHEVPRRIILIEHWNPGTLEPWNSGTLELWNPGTILRRS